MADRKIAELIKDIRGDATLLINEQVELAKAELMPAAKNAGIGGGLFGAAGYFGINAATLIYIGAALGLAALGLPYWAAFLIVAGVLLLIAAIAAAIGYTRIKKVQPPEKTIANGKALVSELSSAVNRATSAASAPQIEGTVVNDKKALR
ncbi:MAG: phage holin family protein [Microlunatus sp.]|nr:phage holin family protein [Microlunatus sp.]MDN5770591.1 phage holin family protein [Microlunatus sp.]MDN5803602.1 phage holin family protein [Microlunatus sp.]